MSDSIADFPFRYGPSEHETRIVEYFSKQSDSDARAEQQPEAPTEQPEAPVELTHEQRMALVIGNDDYLSGRTDKVLKTRNFIICFSNRSGSNLLASLISTNTHVPLAGEIFLQELVIQRSQQQDFKTFGQYVEFMKQTRASEGGVFGVKLSWEQLYFLTRIGVVPKLIEAPVFIHIFRRNVLDQAISFSIALQNLKWTSQDKGIRTDEEVEFNEMQIINIMKANYIARARFQAYFELFGAQVIDVAYEDLQDNLKEVGERVIRQLNLGTKDMSVRPEQVRLKPQRSALNERFRRALTDKYGSFLDPGGILRQS